MNNDLQSKRALVGGASAGMGRACVAALVRKGACVVMVARREAPLREAAEQINRDMGGGAGEALPIAADMSDPDQIDRLLAETTERLGGVDILVTNTGGPSPGTFADVDLADWDAAYRLLLRSAIQLVRGVLPGMRERQWGRIVGITSLAVKEPIGSLILSNVFRSGVTSLYRSLSREVAADGITVNTVLPGATDTERFRDLVRRAAEAEGVPFEEMVERRRMQLPRKRLTTPDEFAQAVAFLASEEAAAVNGVALSVDGGQFTSLM